MAALCLLGATIAARLAAFQLGWGRPPWEPLFGDGTVHVLSSPVSQSLPFPDAALGLFAYLAEALAVAWGGRARFRTRPIAVYVYATFAFGMAFASVGLVLLQAVWIRSFCTLCLVSALLSFGLVVPAATELAATWKARGNRMTESLRGKVVVVTGASAGVGRAAVRAFAKQGANLGLIARGQDGLAAAAREVEQEGGRALFFPIDVADAAAVERAADAIERELGPIDVWVNDAMVSVFAPFMEIDAAEFRRVTEVTFLGYVHGTQAALRRMLPRDRGSIVQVGSALAYRSIPLQSAYCAAKHAVHGLTESIRTELRHDKSKVHITEVQLPAVNTPQFTWSRAKLPNHPQPVPPIFQPELIADAIVYAATHRRREIWLAWPAIQAILSDKLAPRLGDIYLAKTAFSGQQTSEKLRPDRPDDLYDPVPGDYGAHGEFDDRAKTFSLAWWMSKHRAALTVGAMLTAACVVALLEYAW